MPVARRSVLARPLAAGLFAGAALVSLRSPEQPALVSSNRVVSVSAPFVGRSAPAPLAGSGRGGVPVRFFDKIQEALGFKADPVEEAKKTLKEMTAVSKKQAAKEQADLKAKRASTRAAMSVLADTMTELDEAKGKAMQACEIDWDTEESTWDASLSKCAEPVLEKASAAMAALAALETESVDLVASCDAVEASVANRTATAQAVVAELDDEQQKELVKMVQEASQPISDGEALRQYVLAKAEVTDTKRSISEAMAEANVDPATLTGSMREKRASRCKAEVAAAEAKAAEEAAAAAAAKAAEEAAAKKEAAPASEEDGGAVAGVGAATIGAVVVAFALIAGWVVSGGKFPSPPKGSPAPSAPAVSAPAAPKVTVPSAPAAPKAAPKVEVPEIKAPEIKAPEIKAPEMPKVSLPPMPSLKAPEPAPQAPQLLPKAAEVQNKKEDLEVKINKGDLLSELK